ncbi:MAG: hypothetical protein KKD44_27010, partial [Proteobacteria bacterium]|nr:hypothetical protein [Pseudomonadota bacterium]
MRKLIRQQFTRKEVDNGLVEEFVNDLVGTSYTFDHQFTIRHQVKEVINVSFLKVHDITVGNGISIFVLVKVEEVK